MTDREFAILITAIVVVVALYGTIAVTWWQAYGRVKEAERDRLRQLRRLEEERAQRSVSAAKPDERRQVGFRAN